MRHTHAVGLTIAAFLALPCCAQFTIYDGTLAAEAAWRAACPNGAPPIENFESYNAVPSPFSGPSDIVTALPALGIVFETFVEGTFLGVYTNTSQAHSGSNQLANFGGGMAQFSSYRIRPEPGRAIVALGFWQCDPQGDQPMAAFAADGTLVGMISGDINRGDGHGFAAFISSVPVARVEVSGLLGDGYNHIDDLQVVTISIGPPPCAADFNQDGVLNPDDLSDYINAYFSEPPEARADFNLDGIVNPDDLSDYINAYFDTSC